MTASEQRAPTVRQVNPADVCPYIIDGVSRAQASSRR
jgi:hypothetical protein